MTYAILGCKKSDDEGCLIMLGTTYLSIKKTDLYFFFAISAIFLNAYDTSDVIAFHKNCNIIAW